MANFGFATLALPRLESGVLLIDDVDSSLAPDYAAVLIALFE
jgi:hypothetical protein